MSRAVFAWLLPAGVTRLVVMLVLVALIVTFDGLAARPTEGASTVSRQLTAVRKAQAKAERRMRKADHGLKLLRRQRVQDARAKGTSAKKLKRMKARRGSARARLRSVEQRRDTAALELARKLRVHPNPRRFFAADKPRARKQVRSLSAKVRDVRRRTRRIERRVERVQQERRARERRKGRYRQRIDARIERRERAESLLGAHITRAITLAGQKVVQKTTVTPERSGLKRPARGHISQRFGCQRTTGGKGSRRCVRFHDGVDIATPRGAIVRASANGVVAYEGFNPWDVRRRAFIVIIVHRGGLVTTYAHLRPSRRVKAGQYVRRGQTIGYAGVTGHTSGPHVHWEARRGGRMLDPLRFR